eukprot:4493810-Alexandrium_andersonii.AAC.1
MADQARGKGTASGSSRGQPAAAFSRSPRSSPSASSRSARPRPPSCWRPAWRASSQPPRTRSPLAVSAHPPSPPSGPRAPATLHRWPAALSVAAPAVAAAPCSPWALPRRPQL